jgi:hypothetical protein
MAQLIKRVYIYILVGGFNPCLKKKVSWDDYSQYMESHKIHVPNHQPDILFIDYAYYLGCTSKDGTMKMLGFLHQSA